MPELPDVDVERRYLQSTALHRTVAEVRVDRARILDGATPQALGRECASCRAGASCPRSRGEIVRIDVSGRSAYVCLRCQPAP